MEEMTISVLPESGRSTHVYAASTKLCTLHVQVLVVHHKHAESELHQNLLCKVLENDHQTEGSLPYNCSINISFGCLSFIRHMQGCGHSMPASMRTCLYSHNN